MSLRSARGILVLVLFGVGLSHCKGDPDVDVDMRPPVKTVMENALLLDVDPPQRRLAAAETDGGVVVHDLTLGVSQRIGSSASKAHFLGDGSSLILTGSPQGSLGTAWLWRPGDAEARVLSTQVWSNLVWKDDGDPFVAFVERTAEGAAVLRRLFPRECDAGSCPVQELTRIDGAPSNAPGLFVGNRFHWITWGSHGWAFDTVSGSLVEAGGDPSHELHVSPNGDRFVRVTPERHVQLYELGTGAPLWDAVVPGTHGFRSTTFFDEDTFIVNTAGPFDPFPPPQSSYACNSQRCTSFTAGSCGPRAVRGGKVLFCSNTDCFGVRCTAVYKLMHRPGKEFSTRGTSIDREPAVSDDLTTAVWMTYELRNQLGTRTLSWDRQPSVRPLTFPNQINVNVFDFVPGQQRFVFINPQQAEDGSAQAVISVWDGTNVEAIGPVDGYPSPGILRKSPPALYLNGYRKDSVVIQRFAL